MRRALHLYESSVGKKVLMAVTGVLLLGFVVVHLIGNLKVYQGQTRFDAYARFLREMGSPIFSHGEVLWIARFVLLAAVGVHILAAVQLTLTSRRARRTGYRRRADLSFSYASRTMRWGGVILLAFVAYHLLHLTFGTVHPEFSTESVYVNLVRGFRVWPVSVAYIVAMVPLALHVYHGLWSATQTLAMQDGRVKRWRRPVAAAAALLLFAGNVSIPIAVLTGYVR